MSGSWGIHPEYRDVVLHKQLEHMMRQGPRASEQEVAVYGYRKRQPRGSIDKILRDPGLSVLYAEQLTINKDGNEMVFKYPNMAPIRCQVGGQPVSGDGNINITLAAWEDSYFVVERNGPKGTLIERWAASPDGRQLYVEVFYRPQIATRGLIISRLFVRPGSAQSDQ